MRILAPLVLVLLVAGCLSEPDAPGAPSTTPASATAPPSMTPPATPSPTQAEPLALRTLDKGSFSGIHNDTRLLIRAPADWEALWSEHGRAEPLPRVEWGNESVVAVVVHGPTGCGAMHLGNVSYDGTKRVTTIEIVLEVPGDNIQCFVAYEDVYHFAAIPSREGQAGFVERREPTGDGASESGAGQVDGYAFRTLAEGAASGIGDERREVIRDADAWRAFWDEHASREMPAPPLPEVDWAHERVFVATAGERPNSCWAIRVDRIEETASEVVAHVTTVKPAADQMCGQMVTQPYHYVTYPLTQKPLRVVEAG
ncbi:MAG TPA: protease complex subunit PrcB family protein [Candidatus Thermoplasmatota archaeon]|nr:protease complex subunit PrcB family protein [Candidatus Thermoplasmatota archaeon]